MRYGDSFSSVSSSLSVSSWDTTTTVCMFGQPEYSRVGSSQAGQHQHHDQARIRFRFRNDRWMFGQPGSGDTGELHWCVLTNLATQLTSKPDTGGGATDWSTPSFTSFPHYTKYITGGQALCLLDHRNFQCASSKYWILFLIWWLTQAMVGWGYCQYVMSVTWVYNITWHYVEVITSECEQDVQPR